VTHYLYYQRQPGCLQSPTSSASTLLDQSHGATAHKKNHVAVCAQSRGTLYLEHGQSHVKSSLLYQYCMLCRIIKWCLRCRPSLSAMLTAMLHAMRTSLFHVPDCSVQMMTLPSCPALAMVFMGMPRLGAQATSLTQSECPFKGSPCWTHCRFESSSCHIYTSQHNLMATGL